MADKNKTAGGKFLWLFLAVGGLVLLGLIFWPRIFSPGQQGSGSIATSTPLPVAEVISVEQAYQLYQQGVAFIDVRSQEEYDQAHIPGATLLPSKEVINRYKELPADIQLVVYCRSGERSAEAARFLQNVGFTKVSSMDGGLESWIAAGYEVDSAR
jgi:rhodanese-related sulfurtransferase